MHKNGKNHNIGHCMVLDCVASTCLCPKSVIKDSPPPSLLACSVKICETMND